MRLLHGFDPVTPGAVDDPGSTGRVPEPGLRILLLVGLLGTLTFNFGPF